MTDEDLDRAACETGLLMGVQAVKRKLPIDHYLIDALARQGLGDYLKWASVTEAETAERYPQTWYDGFARGFTAAAGAMKRPTRIQEGAGGKILALRR